MPATFDPIVGADRPVQEQPVFHNRPGVNVEDMTEQVRESPLREMLVHNLRFEYDEINRAHGDR